MIQCESKIEQNPPNFTCCFTSSILSNLMTRIQLIDNRFQFSFWNVNLFRCACVSYIWYSSFHLQSILILNIHVSSIPCVFVPCVQLVDDANTAYPTSFAESHRNSLKRQLKLQAPHAASAHGRQLIRQRHRRQQHSSRQLHQQLLLRQSRYTIGLNYFLNCLEVMFFSFLCLFQIADWKYQLNCHLNLHRHHLT